ncbi:MAG: ChbG/HpnK family deacetylase [Hyphomicrobiales bacterium]|nr:ChbG/HpnK family deacetylase [Alphaproteobacteria bacterium]
MPDASATARPIWLCADDYGISPAVSKGIRDLVEQGRLNATSVMVGAPTFNRAEADALKRLNADARRVAIGLHVTLTGKFKPMTAGYRPTRGGTFPSIPEKMVRGQLGLLDRGRLADEIVAQLEAFKAQFGQAPDFFDGHQHSHLFPQVREALLDVVKAGAPEAWVRQCGRVAALTPDAWDYKTRILNGLSGRFRDLAVERGIKTNPAFAGAYDFNAAGADFTQLFPGFLQHLPAQSVVMCHPGFVDAELERLDPLTTQREREYAYFAGPEFPAVLRAHGVTLAR